MKGATFATFCLVCTSSVGSGPVRAGGPTASAPATVPPAAASSIVEGTRTHTARGGGVWRCWSNAAGASVLGANAKAIWFSRQSTLWRYNVETKRVDVWTSPLTHPELDYYVRGCLADDGRLALSCRRAILLWDGKDWSRLPQPRGDNNVQHLAFDGDGGLWANSGYRACRWKGNRWARSLKLRQNGVFWPLGRKWLMWNNYGQGKAGKTYTIWNAALTESQELDPAWEEFRFTGQIYRTGKVSMGVFRAQGQWDGPRILCEVTENGLVEKARGDYVCLDLTRGQAFGVKLPTQTGQRVLIHKDDGTVVAELPAIPKALLKSSHGVLLRDANGDYWRAHWRCDGKSWAPVLPPHGLEYVGSMRDAIRQGRLRYDPKAATWSDAWPEIPVDVRGYERRTRTGWVVRKGKVSEPTVWERFHFAADGTRTRLSTIKARRQLNQGLGFRFELGNDVWLNGAYRWDGHELHYYEDGWDGHASPTHGTPLILASPKGNVWMYHTKRNWLRYDPAEDRFRSAMPFEEFLFEAGGRKLAIVGWPHDRGSGADPGIIYYPENNLWRRLPYPFVAADDPAIGRSFGQCPIYAVPARSVHNGRMLMNALGGVFEWDLQTNQYAYLAAPQIGDCWALFDGDRRLLVSDNAILMYEGEPFAAASQPSAELEAKLAPLVKAMDAESWRQRETATQEAINLIRRNPTEVSAILERQDWARTYSLEVRCRVGIVLRERPGGGGGGSWEADRVGLARRLGNSLLERMHPPRAATIRYVIEPGMDLEHAKSVFTAAGARPSSEIANANHLSGATPLRRGYLLPDNTMVYILLEGNDETAKIASLGLGEVGKGNDPNWDWNDAKRNSVKSLELKPHTLSGHAD